MKFSKKVNNGWLVIYTKNVNTKQLEIFKRLIGNPIDKAWFMFPSEYVKKIEYIGGFSIKNFVRKVVFRLRKWCFKNGD